MMSLKKSISLFISIVLAFGVYSISVSAETNDELFYGTQTVRRFFSTENLEVQDDLSAYSLDFGIDYESLFPIFTDAVCNFEASIDVTKYGITLDNLKIVVGRLFEMLWNKNPEIFYLSNTCSYSHNKNGIVFGLFLFYECTQEEAIIMSSQMKAATEKLVRDLKTSKLSDMQKALILHDRLAVKCEYDESVYTGTETYKVYTSYGALVEGLAVCDGYTKAYSHLLNQLGISNKRCSSEEMNHAWNIVYINEKAYHVDVTWDDPSFANPADKPVGYVRHTNFMLSTNALHNNFEYGYDVGCHESEDFDHEPEDTTFDHYFWRDCTHETILIGSQLYHLNNDEKLCKYDSHNPLAVDGIGDIDNNGEINGMDISHCRKYITGTQSLVGNEFTASDIDGDGKVSIKDLVSLKRILTYM